MSYSQISLVLCISWLYVNMINAIMKKLANTLNFAENHHHQHFGMKWFFLHVFRFKKPCSLTLLSDVVSAARGASLTDALRAPSHRSVRSHKVPRLKQAGHTGRGAGLLIRIFFICTNCSFSSWRCCWEAVYPCLPPVLLWTVEESLQSILLVTPLNPD